MAATVPMYNPARKRRKRRGRATAARLGHRRRRKAYRAKGRTSRRYYRRYRKNPGHRWELLPLMKRALPVLAAIIGGRLIVGAGNRIPGVDRLGVLKRPVLSLVTLLLGSFASRKIAVMRRYDSEIVLGLGLNLLTETISAFAPANVKTMLGMGGVYDSGLSGYQAGNYLPTGDVDPDGDMSNYVTCNRTDEDLELEEELELSDSLGIFGSKGIAPYDDNSGAY